MPPKDKDKENLERLKEIAKKLGLRTTHEKNPSKELGKSSLNKYISDELKLHPEKKELLNKKDNETVAETSTQGISTRNNSDDEDEEEMTPVKKGQKERVENAAAHSSPAELAQDPSHQTKPRKPRKSSPGGPQTDLPEKALESKPARTLEPKSKSTPPRKPRPHVLQPTRAEEAEKEFHEPEQQFKKITRKHIGDIDDSVKVEGETHLKPLVKTKELNKQDTVNHLFRRNKIVFHKTKFGKKAMNE